MPSVKNKPDTRLPARPADTTGTSGLRRSYQTGIYDLFIRYNNKLKPRVERLFNRTGDHGFVKELNEKLNETQVLTIGAGAPKLVDEHVTRAFKHGKKRASDNPRLKRESIIIDSRLSRTDNEMIADLKTRNLNLINQTSEAVKTRIVEIITDDIRQGKGVNIMVKDIQDNILNISKARAKTIARTEMAYSYNNALSKTYQDAGIEKWQWFSALIDTTCRECEALHGELREWDDPQPPLHPNCYCSIYPVVDREFKR